MNSTLDEPLVAFNNGEQTVATSAGSESVNNGDVPDGEAAVRRLTPLECERLQGFPDGWTAGEPDSPRYRMLGNAVAVPVIEWIAKRLVEVDERVESRQR